MKFSSGVVVGGGGGAGRPDPPCRVKNGGRYKPLRAYRVKYEVTKSIPAHLYMYIYPCCSPCDITPYTLQIYCTPSSIILESMTVGWLSFGTPSISRPAMPADILQDHM